MTVHTHSIIFISYNFTVEANHFASYSDQHCSNNCTKVIVDDKDPTVDRETDLTDVVSLPKNTVFYDLTTI